MPEALTPKLQTLTYSTQMPEALTPSILEVASPEMLHLNLVLCCIRVLSAQA